MSPGPGGIYSKTLREAAEQIAGALTGIVVSSLATGEVPEDWRIANVVPLFKKGDRDNPGCNRPVNLMLVGSVLGPLLFVVYINDLEENMAGLISERSNQKYADDTKIGGVADSEEDCQRIQQD
eukprot:g18548.t1